MHLGSSWYPEMWPESEWPGDIARMKELGFTIVRVFEFAWHRFEPVDGQFDFTWARNVMDLCHEAGLAVMVGTPTAAPPAWLTSAHPEVLQVSAGGVRAAHGERRQYSQFSATYRGYCRRIVQRMVEALGSHPALHSWQIDNEIAGFDYSEEAKNLFRNWLKKRFGTIEELNAAWGLEFWSQAYNGFSQINMPAIPSTDLRSENPHPSLALAAARFQSEGWADFIDDQCAILRTGSPHPITTNMCGHGLQHDWFRLNGPLDHVGYSLYKPVEFYHWAVLSFDRMRAEKPRPYWLLETAPNWSGGIKQWNIHHHAAGIYAFTWLSCLLGGNMVLYWQWREHWAGQEMLHGTCVSATGKFRPNHETWKRLASEFTELGDWLAANPPAPAPLAIMMDTEAAWASTIHAIDDNLAYGDMVRDTFYLPLLRRHWWRDVIGPQADLSRYRVLILPMLPMLSTDLRKRLQDWVAAGGHLVLGPLTGTRTTEFTMDCTREFGGLEDWIGAREATAFSAHWREGKVLVSTGTGETCAARAWCIALEPQNGAQVLARYSGDGEYGDEMPAVVEAAYGAGRVLTLGALVSPEVFLALVEPFLRRAGLAPLAQGDGDVVVIPRQDASGRVSGYGVCNLAEEPRSVHVSALGRLDLAALGVQLKRIF